MLSGIIPPLLTPVTAAGSFDPDTMRKHVDWLIEKGVDGVFPNGSTGEFTRFNSTTRRQIAETVVAAAAGRVPVVSGIAEHDVPSTVAACQDYKSLGVSAGVIVSPIYFQFSQPGIEAYFKAIAAESSLDILLYNIPAFATAIAVDTVAKLAQSPRIIGIKDSSGDLVNMMRMIALVRPTRPDFLFFTGWDALLAAMLSHGAVGGMVATGGVVPEVMTQIYKLASSGKISEAIELQKKQIPLFDELLSVKEFPAGFRLAAAARGFETGDTRTPIGDLQRSQYTESRQRIQTLVNELLAAVG